MIGGNVSLYNESGGADIDPTPVLGVLGLVDACARRPPGRRWSEGDAVVLLGAAPRPTAPSRWRVTRWATERRGHRTRRAARRRSQRTPRCAPSSPGWSPAGGRTSGPAVHAVHDVSSGGLAVALAEMAVAGETGCAVARSTPSELFTELPSRFVVATADPDELCARAEARGIPAAVLGRAGGERLRLGDLVDLCLEALGEATTGSRPGPGDR